LTAQLTTTFVWRDEYAVGVAQIDEQHRRLIEMIASFYEALATREKTQQALGDLLAGLLEYTRYHFSTEEGLMQRTSYPQLEAHKREHAGFVTKVSDMEERFVRGRLVLSLEATVFVREWLSRHILVVDKVLGRHLNAHGVQ
jgi:hemerythrin-like metal-binding protein